MASPFSLPAEADILYDVRRPDPDTPTEYPNLSTDGTTGPATNAGLDVLTGPGFWFPGVTDHDLVVDDGTVIPSTRGLLTLPHTTGAVTIVADDVDADAGIFTASTGQDVAIGQGTPIRMTEAGEFRITEDGHATAGE